MTEKLIKLDEVLNGIQKNLKSPKGLQNKFGNFAYRNAEGILHAFKEEIAKPIYPANITIITDCDIVLIGNRTFIKCEAFLSVGSENTSAVAFAELDLVKKGMDQAQLTGAATSYAKKYALCNLLAIDDSKDDPDADEKPKEIKKNAFGLSSDGPLAAGDDMKEMLQKSNEDSVERLIAAVKKKKSIAELEEWLENKLVKKEMNRLEKYLKPGFNSVMMVIEGFRFMNRDIDDSALSDEISK
jgi:hypothetical protein